MSPSDMGGWFVAFESEQKKVRKAASTKRNVTKGAYGRSAAMTKSNVTRGADTRHTIALNANEAAMKSKYNTDRTPAQQRKLQKTGDFCHQSVYVS